MSNKSAVDCEPFTLAQVFNNDFYVIPDYQRDYVWNSDHVTQLLNDIESAKCDDAEGHYFIGSFLVTRDSGDCLELIDGQQRMTSLFLILCCLRNLLTEDEHKQHIRQLLSHSHINPGTNRLETRTRLKANCSANQEILEKALDSPFGKPQGATNTTPERMMATYNTAEKFFGDQYPEGEGREAKLWDYHAYMMKHVCIVQIATHDLASAVVVFETINDRGVGLDAFDLLKNLLYKSVSSDSERSKITEIWGEVKERVNDADSNKPLRFLRYFISSQFDTADIIRDANAYQWLEDKDNAEVTKVESNPVGFAKRILETARVYRCILTRQENPHGNRSKTLSRLILFTGSAARQHLPVLMASDHLGEDDFEKLVETLETALFYSFLSGERSQDLEKKVFAWTKLAREASSRSSIKDLHSRIASDSDPSKKRFFNNFANFSLDNTRQYRMKYILARIELHVEERADALKSNLEGLIKEFDIEHILPQSEDSLKKFSEENPGISENDASELCQYVGNLVLLEKSINKRIGDAPFSTKKQEYGDSVLLMVKSLSGKTMGGNSKRAKTMRQFAKFEDWNMEAISNRQILLKDLIREIWTFEHSQGSVAES